MSAEDLAALFEKYALAQDHAQMFDDIPKVNKLFSKIEDIKRELRRREGDQRRLLMRFYDHSNAQVQLKAAKATLAIAPKEARELLTRIAATRIPPQALDARMCLWMLDRGEFKPE